MARVIFSSLVDEIRGRLNGDVFSTWKGITYLKKGTIPRNPISTNQASNRQTWSYLTGSYDELSSVSKTAWDYYASLLPTSMSGFNAFVKLNQSLITANYTTLVKIYSAPAAPTPPSGSTGFAFTYNAGANRWEAAWATPSNYTEFVQVFISPITGYRDNLYPTWSLYVTVPGAFLTTYVPSTNYPTATQMCCKIRVINQNGEISASSATITTTKT